MGIWVAADHLANILAANTHYGQNNKTYNKNNGQGITASIHTSMNALMKIGIRTFRDTYDGTQYNATTPSNLMIAVKYAETVPPANSNQSSVQWDWGLQPGGTNAVASFGSSTTVGSKFYNFLHSNLPIANMLSAETINEQDLNAPSSYAGGPGTAGSVASVQQDFFNAMGTTYPGVIRLAPSMGNPVNSANVTGISSWCDHGNLHMYTFSAATATTGGGFTDPAGATFGWNGSSRNWLGGIGLWNGAGCQICPGINHWCTETGLPNYYQIENNGGFTDEYAGGLYALHSWFWGGLVMGLGRIFLYEAADEVVVPQSREDRFGHCIRPDCSIKTGGQAIANSLALLYDPNPGALVLNQNIQVAISGNTTSLISGFIQYSNGDLGIIAYQQLSYGSGSGTGYGTSAPYHYPAGPTTPQNAQSVTFDLSQQWAYSEWYQPLDQANVARPLYFQGPNSSIVLQPNYSPIIVLLKARQKINVPTQQNILTAVPPL